MEEAPGVRLGSVLVKGGNAAVILRDQNTDGLVVTGELGLVGVGNKEALIAFGVV